MENALVIMIKNPVAGKVKTRLASEIGEEMALKVYKYLLSITQKISSEVSADKFVFYSDVVDRYDEFNPAVFKKYVQCSGELGVRMDYAFSIPFKNEYSKVIMIGSDCPEISASIIETAFEKLSTHDFVLGPADDGGYYLIGMKRWNRWLFENKSWSTPSLFEETKNEILQRNGQLFILDQLSDIDTIEDLQHFPELLEIIR